MKSILDRELENLKFAFIDTKIRCKGLVSLRKGSNLEKAIEKAQGMYPDCFIKYVIGGRAGKNKNDGYHMAIIAVKEVKND